MRVRLSGCASDVVAMYAAEGPDDVWPELAALQAWDGSALVVDHDNSGAVAEVLLQLCNLYDDKAEGVAPTTDGEPRRFCRHASRGLGKAWDAVMAFREGC